MLREGHQTNKWCSRTWRERRTNQRITRETPPFVEGVAPIALHVQQEVVDCRHHTILHHYHDYSSRWVPQTVGARGRGGDPKIEKQNHLRSPPIDPKRS